MVPAITAEQMREADRLAVEKYGIKVHRLMNLAGLRAAEVAKALLNGSAEKKKILVLAGKGNNGGDAIFAARYLSQWGASCVMLFPFAKGAGKPVIEQQLSMAAENIQRHFLEDYKNKNLGELFSGADLIIDGLLGYSLSGNPEPDFAELINKANESGKKILAIDVPSGLDSTTGEPGSPCIRAYSTITLALPKTGLVKQSAKQYTGELFLGDIGIPLHVYSEIGVSVGDVFAGRQIIRL